jgi:hypothetical protein
VAPTDASVDAVTGVYTVTSTCDTGFHLSAGDGVMTCASDLAFDITEPTCEGRFHLSSFNSIVVITYGPITF